MSATANPLWVNQPPSSYDIVTAYYPETRPKTELRLRPCLVTKVFQADDGEVACELMFGTKHLKVVKRGHLDIIVDRPVDITRFGLGMATRFDLDSAVLLPWTPEFVGCWQGHSHPRIGALDEEFIRDYAYKMLSRRSI